jgi:hypothetical protein
VCVHCGLRRPPSSAAAVRTHVDGREGCIVGTGARIVGTTGANRETQAGCTASLGFEACTSRLGKEATPVLVVPCQGRQHMAVDAPDFGT